MYSRINSKIVPAIIVLAVAMLACGRAGRQELILYPTPTPNASPTVVVVQITVAPVRVIVEVTQTPNAAKLCVQASLAVFLRPAPNEQNYPIMAIPNGTKLVDLGGRNGQWLFVALGDKQGWVYNDYLGECP